MATLDDNLSSVVFMQPEWIAMNGGWVHANNVLFYFAQSPFFDRTSSNQTVIVQSQGIPEREFENLSTRQRFEAAISRQVGLQYVVAHDPLESKAKYKGPDGEEQSDVWVIRRQLRKSKDEIVVTGFYYIMNQAIFQAPSVASILSYRLLNTTLAMKQVFSDASALPMFSATHGHTYHRPVQKAPTAATVNGQSKDVTPMPDIHTTTTDRSEASGETKIVDDSSARTLREALSLSLRYGREYMDEMPLTGEPGAFRFAKIKEGPGQTQAQAKPHVLTSKSGTPAPASRAASPPPPILTDVPLVSSKKSSAKSPSGDNPLKPKRRKSKAALSPE